MRQEVEERHDAKKITHAYQNQSLPVFAFNTLKIQYHFIKYRRKWENRWMMTFLDSKDNIYFKYQVCTAYNKTKQKVIFPIV